MSEGQHDLVNEFPMYREQIHAMKTANPHFRKLFDEYHDVTKSITRSEQRLDMLSEIEEETLRKRRLALKDELYGLLKQA